MTLSEVKIATLHTPIATVPTDFRERNSEMESIIDVRYVIVLDQASFFELLVR